MKKISIVVILLIVPLFAGCSSKETSAILGAKRGIATTSFLTRSFIAHTAPVRPSAMLGVHATLFTATRLSKTVSAALDGIHHQFTLVSALDKKDTKKNPYAMVEALANTMEINVLDLLNRSPNRQKALDAYETRLFVDIERGSQHFALLKEEHTDVKSDVRAMQKEVRRNEKDLKKIIKNKEFSLASGVQEELSMLQQELTRSEIMEEEIDSSTDLLEELLESGEERMEALQKFREVLIAGIRIPDDADISILEDASKKRSRWGRR